MVAVSVDFELGAAPHAAAPVHLGHRDHVLLVHPGPGVFVGRVPAGLVAVDHEQVLHVGPPRWSTWTTSGAVGIDSPLAFERGEQPADRVLPALGGDDAPPTWCRGRAGRRAGSAARTRPGSGGSAAATGRSSSVPLMATGTSAAWSTGRAARRRCGCGPRRPCCGCPRVHGHGAAGAQDPDRGGDGLAVALAAAHGERAGVRRIQAMRRVLVELDLAIGRSCRQRGWTATRKASKFERCMDARTTPPSRGTFSAPRPRIRKTDL